MQKVCLWKGNNLSTDDKPQKVWQKYYLERKKLAVKTRRISRNSIEEVMKAESCKKAAAKDLCQ